MCLCICALTVFDAKPCALCGYDRAGLKTAFFAGEERSICLLCAGAAAAVLTDATLETVRACLHLYAMELEQETPLPQKLFFAKRRWLSRLRARFTEGYFRENCPCDTCNGRPHADAIADLHEAFGLQRETTIDRMDWLVLRGFKATQVFPASDGSLWRVDDEIARRTVENYRATQYPGIKPGGLADRAAPRVPGRWKIDAEGNDFYDTGPLT